MLHDLHRHFSGSISVPTVAKLANISQQDVSASMTYSENDKRDYDSFFRKFDVLNKINWDYDKIDYAVRDVIWGIKREGLEYAEIKFSIQKYLKIDSDPVSMIKWFANCFHSRANEWGVDADLILSLTYESDRNIQREIADSIFDDGVANLIAGIDLVGNERYFNREFYEPIINNWHDAGKLCLAHVGEINNINNVRDAIKHLKVHRICHGLACVNDEEAIKMALDNDIVFDVSITSNHLTGVADKDQHPVKFMLERGCKITVGTDDPVIFRTTLDNEYRELVRNVSLNMGQLKEIVNNSIAYSAKSRRN